MQFDFCVVTKWNNEDQQTAESGMNPAVENLVNQMLIEIEHLATENYAFQDRIYRQDDSKLGSRRFIARQPQATKEWRCKIKGLLKEYLSLKFLDEKQIELPFDNNSNQEEKIFRFNIKVNGKAIWYELSQPRLDRYSVLSFRETNRRQVALLSNKESLVFQKGVLTRIFSGCHLETIVSTELEKRTDSFWAGWKTPVGAFNGLIACFPTIIQDGIYNLAESFAATNSYWEEYQKIIHPNIKKASLDILRSYQERCPQVVEICGGSGELAVQIAKDYQQPMNYYLLEYNDRALRRAKYNILSSPLPDYSDVIPIKTDVTNLNDYFIDAEKQLVMQNHSIDLIIGSGALTGHVLENKEAALQVARKCYALLKPKGKLILSGHVYSLLSSKDFEMLGFTVINSMLIGVQDEPFSTHVNAWVISLNFHNQFYILEK